MSCKVGRIDKSQKTGTAFHWLQVVLVVYQYLWSIFTHSKQSTLSGYQSTVSGLKMSMQPLCMKVVGRDCRQALYGSTTSPTLSNSGTNTSPSTISLVISIHYYRPPRIFREGNVFSCVYSSVSHSVHSVVPIWPYPWCIGPHCTMPPCPVLASLDIKHGTSLPWVPC